uniref:NERD domain-containing protein n=1 Tax=Anguilla anguilla TaxID=7936 RepID=A0A0E9TBE8_ANGAN
MICSLDSKISQIDYFVLEPLKL